MQLVEARSALARHNIRLAGDRKRTVGRVSLTKRPTMARTRFPGVPASRAVGRSVSAPPRSTARDGRGPHSAASTLTRNAVQLRKHFYRAARLVAGLLVVLFAMTGAAKLADQIVTWLAFAVWRPFTIADALRFWGIPAPQAPQRLGLARLTDAVLSLPGILAYLLLAGACFFHVCKDRSRARQALAQVPALLFRSC
jgi:hypothetical protein